MAKWQWGFTISHDDPEQPSAIASGTIDQPGYYRIEFQVTANWTGEDASSDCSECEECGECSAAGTSYVDATVVGISKIVKSGSSYEGPSHVFTGKNQSLDVVSVPHGESFPANKLINRISVKPEGSQLSDMLGSHASVYIQPDVIGVYVVLATCGNSTATYTIKAYELDVNNNQVDVYVGQIVSLTAAVNPQPPQNTSYFWSIPTAVTVKGYSLNENGSSTDAFTSSDFWNKSISFYFVDSPADSKVSVRARISYGDNNEFISSQDTDVNCSVFVPTATLTSKTTSEDPPIDVGDDNFFRFGNPDHSSGIEIEGKVTTVPNNGLNEQIGLIQLIKVEQSGFLVPYGFGEWDTGDEYVLDNGAGNGAFYEPPQSIVEISSVGRTFLFDSPGTNVFYHTSIQRSDNFKTYLMYKPDDTGIWVPLMKLDWDWQGSAERSSLFSEWAVNTSIFSKNPSGSSTTEFPEWSQTWNNLN